MLAACGHVIQPGGSICATLNVATATIGQISAHLPAAEPEEQPEPQRESEFEQGLLEEIENELLGQRLSSDSSTNDSLAGLDDHAQRNTTRYSSYVVVSPRMWY